MTSEFWKSDLQFRVLDKSGRIVAYICGASCSVLTEHEGHREPGDGCDHGGGCSDVPRSSAVPGRSLSHVLIARLLQVHDQRHDRQKVAGRDVLHAP